MTPAATRADVLMVVARAGSALSEVQRSSLKRRSPIPARRGKSVPGLGM